MSKKGSKKTSKSSKSLGFIRNHGETKAEDKKPSAIELAQPRRPAPKKGGDKK